MSTQFSDRIRAIMQEQELSAKEFAERIAVQRSSISHLISGRNKPSVDFIIKLTNAFPEINPQWLLHGKGTMQITPVTSSDVTDVSDSANTEFTSTAERMSVNTFVTPDEFDRTKKEEREVKSATDISISPTKKESEPTPNLGRDSRHVKKIILVYNDGSFEVLEK